MSWPLINKGSFPADLGGQTLAAEPSWGDLPIQFVGTEPEEAADVPPHRDLLKGMLIGFALAVVAAILGLSIGTAIFFKIYF